jgi:hypothetical protein
MPTKNGPVYVRRPDAYVSRTCHSLSPVTIATARWQFSCLSLYRERSVHILRATIIIMMMIMMITTITMTKGSNQKSERSGLP